jgi:ribosomal protein S18 acetylase RimI-like enzyme
VSIPPGKRRAGASDGLVIRKLRAEDLPRFFYPADLPLGEKWLGQQERGEMYVAVAEIDGVAVGRSCLLYNFKGDPPNAYSFASTVSAEWQSRGIGSAIIAHHERVAQSRGMYQMSSHTATDNPRAAAWRDRMGYRRVGEETIQWDEIDGRHVESRSWRFERSFTPPISYRIRGWARSKWRRWPRLGTTFASPAFAMVLLAVTAILVKLPTLDTPAYWDEMGWLRQAHELSEGNLLRAIPGFRAAGAFWGHPPGLHLILAALGKVFGVSVSSAHALIVVFAAVGVCATFLLARNWYGTRTAWLAALFLLLSPVYFAQSGMFLADVPVTALGVLATYFLVKDRYVPYVACASCMVLLKETAIALVIALLLYRFVVLNPFRQARLRDVARYSVPLAVIGSFILLQKATTGDFFFIYDFDVELFQLTPALAWHHFGSITRWIFIDQYRFIFTALIVLNLLVNGNARRRELWLFGFVVVLSGYSFSVLYYLPRYLLPILPLFYILAAASLFDLARRPGLQLIAACVALGMMSWSLMSQPLDANGETSPRYLEIVAMHEAAIDRLVRERPNARVLTTWPHTEELRRPLLGYVQQQIDAKEFRTDSDLRDGELILVSQPANGREVRLRELARRDAWRLILRREKESAWIELYSRP